MRPVRLLAIARLDLAQELGGRRGWMLPGVMAGLLFPAAAIPLPRSPVPSAVPILTVSGDVPDAVATLPQVEVVPSGGALRLERNGDALLARGPLPGPIRDALDAGSPPLQVEMLTRPVGVPQRTLLLGLISGSSLTGAVSASIAGERSRRTLVALLSAAITRAELITGKWLAWAGLGTLGSLLAALVAVWLGRVDAGPWILPLVTVPGGTVALGLFLARRAGDVVGGTTVSLRVVPASLALLALCAWFVGQRAPLLGAAVPLGGALLTAGATWPGVAPAVVGALGTALFTAIALAWTAWDLEESPSGAPPRHPWVATGRATALAAFAWWIPLLAPLLWSAAGNPILTERMPVARGLAAGGLGLFLLTVVRLAREPSARPAPPTPGWTRWALLGAVALWASAPAGHWTPLPAAPLGALAATRLDGGTLPGWAGLEIALLVLVADELLFRGWLLRMGGPVAACTSWILVKSPHDPVHGACVATICTALAVRTGSPWPSLVARCLWTLAAGSSLGLSPGIALLVGLAAATALGVPTRAATSGPS